MVAHTGTNWSCIPAAQAVVDKSLFYAHVSRVGKHLLFVAVYFTAKSNLTSMYRSTCDYTVHRRRPGYHISITRHSTLLLLTDAFHET